MIEAIRQRLLPLTFVATPNIPEARGLAGGLESLDECAAVWLRLGCGHVLITGTHSDSGEVVNRLYGADATAAWAWPRLPHEYHGSGCTLASALAAGLAQGLGLEEACRQAQAFTWGSLEQAFKLGRGQWLPKR